MKFSDNDSECDLFLKLLLVAKIIPLDNITTLSTES